MPDPTADLVDSSNGEVVYPLGTPVAGPAEATASGHLLYNEYIVYDVAQAQQKYLVWVDFKYN